MKFALVVNNDTTLHGVQTDTVAFSSSVLIKCSICAFHQLLTRTPHGICRQTDIFYHHGNVTVVDVACLVTQRSGGAEFGDRCSSFVIVDSRVWGSSAAGTLG